MSPFSAPEGYEPLPELKGFVHYVGPLHWRPRKDDFALAFRVDERHVNIGGVVHGGMLMTVADMALALGTRVIADLDAFLPTIQINADFVAPGRLGDWVEGRTRVLRRTRRMAFASCTLSAGERLLMRATGIMKIARQDDATFRVPEADKLEIPKSG